MSRHFLNVECARTIDESRELARHCRFHLLVLVDPEQPWRELKNALEDYAELPSATLLIVDKARAEQAVDALRGGVADVLLRPFSTDDLVAVVDAICTPAETMQHPGTDDAPPRDLVSPDYRLDWTLEQVKRDHMARVLEACDGNKSAAARRLGISRKTLDRKLGMSGHE
jgi:DNA-binding NtrC family response regulator